MAGSRTDRPREHRGVAVDLHDAGALVQDPVGQQARLLNARHLTDAAGPVNDLGAGAQQLDSGARVGTRRGRHGACQHSPAHHHQLPAPDLAAAGRHEMRAGQQGPHPLGPIHRAQQAAKAARPGPGLLVALGPGQFRDALQQRSGHQVDLARQAGQHLGRLSRDVVVAHPPQLAPVPVAQTQHRLGGPQGLLAPAARGEGAHRAADLLRGQHGGQRQPRLGPRARALGQVKPGPAPRGPGAAVDRRVELGDHPQLAHPRLNERGCGDVPHAHGGVQHLRHLAAFLRGGEVGAHPALEVHGAAHVEHLVGRRAELVDAGAAGQGVGQAALGPALGRDRV